MEKSRIAALADGIFAVAMTLLVLDLKLPEAVKTTTDAEVWQQVIDLKGHFMMYALSFIVLSSYWIAHHFQLHFVHKVDRGVLWLNLLFLLFIALVPFSTNLLAGRNNLHVPVVFYGVNLFLLSLIFLMHLHYLTRHPELCHEALTPARVIDARRRSVLAAFISGASIAISFYSPRLALSSYWLLFALPFLFVRSERHL